MTLDITKNPLVSIVVSVYNDAPYLDRTMFGLMNQSYYNLEIIVIDDGSTDESLAILQYYAAQDSRIHIIAKPNTGVSSSRNVGIEHASGTWIYFADADDWMARTCIECLVKALYDGCDLVISSFYRVHGFNAALKESPVQARMSCLQFAKLMRQRPANLYYASLWNKLFRCELLKKHNLRFDTSVSFGEDHIFILEYLHFVQGVSMIKEGLYYYVDNQDSLLHQGLNFAGVVRMKYDTIKPYCRFFKQMGLYKTPLQKGRAWLFSGAVSTDYFVYDGARLLEEKEVPDHILPASGEERDVQVKIWQQENDLQNIKEKIENLRLDDKLNLNIKYIDLVDEHLA